MDGTLPAFAALAPTATGCSRLAGTPRPPLPPRLWPTLRPWCGGRTPSFRSWLAAPLSPFSMSLASPNDGAAAAVAAAAAAAAGAGDEDGGDGAAGMRLTPPVTRRDDVGTSATPIASFSRRAPPASSSSRGDVGGTLEPIRRSPVLAARASAAAAEEEDEEEPYVGGEWDLRLVSPAKINLYLRVMRRREDGFHELESLFQAVSLHDTLRFRIKRRAGGDATAAVAPASSADGADAERPDVPGSDKDVVDAKAVPATVSTGVHDVSIRDGPAEPTDLPARPRPVAPLSAVGATVSADSDDGGVGRVEKNEDDLDVDTLECTTPGVPTDGSNLVLRALAAFRAATGVTTRYHVHLTKAIPHEAGLGGGSSNAATALWAANHLAGRPLSPKQLADIGAGLGSDVAFFFSPGTALCSGRGEAFTAVPRLPPAALYIVKPPVGLSTPAVFRALDLNAVSDVDPDTLLADLRTSLYGARVVNDLEAPSFALAPELADLKALLVGCGFKVVLMSGSGSSFYCLGEPAEVGGLERALRAAGRADVRVLRAMFITRRAATMEGEPPGGDWYMDGKVEPLRPLRYNPTSLVG
ncbi:hypothetical protein MMPV_002269 [Pyropia vietnamensis]